MKESKAVYVTKRDIRENLLNREYQLHSNNTIEVNKYRLTNDVGIQYNSKRDNVYQTHRNLVNARRHYEHDLRYFNPIPKQIYTYSGSRSFTDIGVGSIKALQKKKVKKIYLPETDDRGVGSSNLTDFVTRMQSLQNRSKTVKQYRPVQSYYETKRTSSKCVGGGVEYRTECLVSAKVSPIVHTRSVCTCPNDPSPEDLSNEIKGKTNRDIDTGTAVIEKVYVTTHTQFEEPELEVLQEKVVKTLKPIIKEINAQTPKHSEALIEIVDIKPAVKEPIKQSVVAPMKPSAITKKNEVLSDPGSSEINIRSVYLDRRPDIPSGGSPLKGSFSSDSLIQHVHNLEQPSEYSKQRDHMENKMEREYRKIFASPSRDQKDNDTVEKQMPKKSTSLFRRRFTAIRKTLGKNDSKTPLEPNQTSVPSVRDASITSDPPSLEEKSFSSNQGYPKNKRHKPQRRASYKKSYTGKKSSKNWSKANVVESEYNQGVMGMFKLWGRKFNLESPSDIKEDTLQPSLEDRTKEKGELLTKRQPERDSVLSEVAVGEIEKDKEKKEGKKFSFFKKKLSKDKTKNQNQTYKNKKGVTTGRCEVKDGLSLKMGARPPTPKSKSPAASVKKQLSKPIDAESTRAAWLMKYLNNEIESRNSVRVRWNNKKYTASSSTVFELMGSVYKNIGIVLKSKSDISTDVSSSASSYNPPNANFVQEIEAWMIPKTITDHEPPVTLKNFFENFYTRSKREIKNENNDQKWIIDNTNVCAHNVEVVLHSKNFVKLQKPKRSSDFLRINIPRHFFNDSSSDERRAEHVSLEKICKIVEYESLDFGPEMGPAKTRSYISNSGDHGTQSQNIQVTASMKSEQKEESKMMETIIKRPQAHKDVLIQGSDVYITKLCDVVGVGIITGRETRQVTGPIIRALDYLSDDKESDHRHLKHFTNNSTFARSYLLESYRHWQQPGLELFSSCVSEAHMQCCSRHNSWDSYDKGDATRSCPNIFGEYVIMVSSYSSGACQNTKCGEDKGKKKEKEKRDTKENKQNEKKTSEIAPRVQPKDSLEVFKKRKIYAEEKSRWMDGDDQCSVNRNEDAGFQGVCKKCSKKAAFKKTAKISSDTACTFIDIPCCTETSCSSNAETCCIHRKRETVTNGGHDVPACCKANNSDFRSAPAPPSIISHKSPHYIQSPKVCHPSPYPAVTPICPQPLPPHTCPQKSPQTCSPRKSPPPALIHPHTPQKSPPPALKQPHTPHKSPPSALKSQKRLPFTKFATTPPKTPSLCNPNSPNEAIRKRRPTPYPHSNSQSCDKCGNLPCYLAPPSPMPPSRDYYSHDYQQQPSTFPACPDISKCPHRSCQTKAGSFPSISPHVSVSFTRSRTLCESYSNKESIKLLGLFSRVTETQTLSEPISVQYSSQALNIGTPKGHRCLTGIKLSNADCVGLPQPQTYGTSCPFCPDQRCLSDCPNKKTSHPKTLQNCQNFPPKPRISKTCPPGLLPRQQKSPCPHEMKKCPSQHKSSCPHKIPFCPNQPLPPPPKIPPCPHKTPPSLSKKPPSTPQSLPCPPKTFPSPPITSPLSPITPPSPLKTPPFPHKTPTYPPKTPPCPPKTPPIPLKTPPIPPKKPPRPTKALPSPPKTPPSPPKTPPSPPKTSPCPPKTPPCLLKTPPYPTKTPESPFKTSPCPPKIPENPPKSPQPQSESMSLCQSPPKRCPSGFKISNTNCEKFGGHPGLTSKSNLKRGVFEQPQANKQDSFERCEQQRAPEQDSCKSSKTCSQTQTPLGGVRDCYAKRKQLDKTSSESCCRKEPCTMDVPCPNCAALSKNRSPATNTCRTASPCYIQITAPLSCEFTSDNLPCKCPTPGESLHGKANLPSSLIASVSSQLIENQIDCHAKDCQNPIRSKSLPQQRPVSDSHENKMPKSQPNLAREVIGIFLKKYPRKINVQEKENITFELGEDNNLSEKEKDGCMKIYNEDNITIVERKDYKKSNHSMVNNIYNDTKGNSISAPITINKVSSVERENKLEKIKSSDSVINMIEINFKLRVIKGDKTTEINIANENSDDTNGKNRKKFEHSDDCSKEVYILKDENKTHEINAKKKKEVYIFEELSEADKINAKKNKEVYILKDENEADEINPKNDDLNIRILIKNYKTKKRLSKKEKAVNDFAQKISKKFNTVSTAYSVDLKGEHTDDTCFSIHRTTIDLTTSDLTVSKENFSVEEKRIESEYKYKENTRSISKEISSHVVGDASEAENMLSDPYADSKTSFAFNKDNLNLTKINTLREHTQSKSSRYSKHNSKNSITSKSPSSKFKEHVSSMFLHRSIRSIKLNKSDEGCTETENTFDNSESINIKESAKTSELIQIKDSAFVVEDSEIFKSHARLSVTDTDDRDISLGNRTSDEPPDLQTKTSDEHIDIVGKSSDDHTDHNDFSKMSEDPDSDMKTSDFVIEKIPINEIDLIDLGMSKKEEKKVMLKEVFEYANFKKPKTKSRIKRLKDILTALLTSDDTDSETERCCREVTEDVTGYIWNPKGKRKTDSLNNYFEAGTLMVSKSALETNTYDSLQSYGTGYSEDEEKPKGNTCLCSDFAEKLNLNRGGCCCSRKPEQVCEQVSCHFVNELSLQDYSFFTPSVECVHCQTNNSRYKSSIHCSKVVSISSKKTSFITPQWQKTPKESSTTTPRSQKSSSINHFLGEEPESKEIIEPISSNRSDFKYYSIEKSSGEGQFLQEADEDPELVPISTTVSRRKKSSHGNNQETESSKSAKSKEDSSTSSPTKRKTNKKQYMKIKNQADILQMYETKKAVLEIYAEKTVTDDEEHLVAKLPKFDRDTEGQLYDSYGKLERNSYKRVFKRNFVMMCIGR